MPTARNDRDVDIAALRARVAELETELIEQARRSATVIARSQEKLYWLERWQVDLDAVMDRPGAIQVLESLRRARAVVRQMKKLKRRMRRR